MRLLGSIERQISLLRHGLRRFLSREPKTGPPELDLRFLEDRILYSAAPLACELLASEGMVMDDPNHMASNADWCAPEHLENSDAMILSQENNQGFESLFAQLAPLDSLLEQDKGAGDPDTPIEVSHELIVIDSSLEDEESLLSSWLSNRDDHLQFTVLLVDRQVNGVDLLGEYLTASGIRFDAIHFVTHGIAGSLELGDVTLSAENLEKHAASLAMWRSGMTDQTELLLYGCSIAFDSIGSTLVDELAKFLQVDIAASTNWTGPESLGGDWVLEYSYGQIETPTLFGDTNEYWRFILSANNAPILNNSIDPTLGTVLEGAANPTGVSVASMLVDGSITDPDGSAVEAIAITGLNTTLGSWQYSLNGGDHWLTIDASGINSQGNELALLLGPAAQLRMIPFGDLNGTLSDAITFRAWDQTSGTQGQYVLITSTGGTSAFSDASDIASMIVAGVNDAPTFFAGDGIVTHFAGTGNSISYGMAIQPDGKVLLTGYGLVGGTEDFAMIRFNIDGSLDSSFGNGTGKVTTSIGSGTEWSYSAVVQADGKIVLGGTVSGSNDDFALVRYNADGSLDSGFGNGGKVVTSIGAGTDQGFSIVVQVDGKLVVGGYSQMNGTLDFALVRYNSDGSLDSGFGNGGKVTTAIGSSDDQAWAISLQPDGKILAGGVARMNGTEDFALVRYNSDGTLDSGFGNGGRVTTAFDSGNDRAWSIVLQPDSKIVMGGSATVNGKLDFALARYQTDGSLDTSFGNGGRVITSLCPDNDVGRSVTLQSDGKILVAGYARLNNLNEFAVARYNTDGTLDSSFGSGGTVITSVGSGNDYGLSVRVQTDGRILVGGFANAGVPNHFALVRYNVDGSLDSTFDPQDTLGGTVTYRLLGNPVVLDSDVRIFDADMSSSSLSGTTLTLARIGLPDSQDSYHSTGTLGALVEGNNLTVDGTLIGTVTTNSGGTLMMTFNSFATNGLVNAAMQQIAFANTNEPPFSQFQILWTFNDRNNGSQGTGGQLATTGAVTVRIGEPNQAPVAIADFATATEAGGDSNSTAGTNPVGNVLMNDLDVDIGDTKTISGVVAGTFSSAVGNVASSVPGAFGSITVAANGSFNYVVNNSNASVQALRTSSNTLTDVFTYTMRDAGGLSSTTQITITIQGANDNPYDLSGVLSIAENATSGTSAGTITSSDVDLGDGATFSLVDNAVGRFAINGSTGLVTVSNGSILDRESAAAYNITVRVTDSAGAAYDKVFAVSVIDVDEFDVGVITDINDASNSIAENAFNGATVGITAFASDADATINTITYSLDESVGGRFAINSSTGVVTVANGSLLNYEAATSHVITVRATSSDGSFSSANFTISLADVDEFDVGVITDTNNASNSIAENAFNGVTVGITAFASDADSTSNTMTYSLDESAGGRFAINSSTGVVTVANGSLLNYEAATSHVITVRATSSDGSFSSANFTISLIDVDEFDVGVIIDINDASNSIAENAFNGATVGITAFASDPDATINTITYSLDESAEGRFAINSSTGVVTVADRSLLNYEAATSHVITVRATSSDGSVSVASFTISVLPANQRPIAFGERYQTDFVNPIPISLSQLLLNDFDPDGDALHLVLLATPAAGECFFIDDETFYYQPKVNFIGQVYILYAVSDGTLVSDPTSVEIAITSPSSIVVAPPLEKQPLILNNKPELIATENEKTLELPQSSVDSPTGSDAAQSYDTATLIASMVEIPAITQSSTIAQAKTQTLSVSVLEEFVRERISLFVPSGVDYSTSERLFIDPADCRVAEPKQPFLERFGVQVERVSELTSDQGPLHGSVPAVGLGTAISAGISLHVLMSAHIGSAILSQANLSWHTEAIMLESYSKSKAVKGAVSLYEFQSNLEWK